ncbi:uncharacterized protein LOC125236593 isoform X2 [Leguminivora glycinivorella]|nr:uncharacterized protein LOC125236593 isoform X2 [Leguminivora glycinivorella]
MLLVTSALMLTPALYYSKTRHSLYITTDMSSAVSPRRVGECCGARVRARYMLLVTSALMLTPALYYSKTRHSLYITTDMSSAVSPRRVGECCGARVRARYMLLVTSALMLTPALYYSKTRHSLYITTDMSSAVSPRRVGECCGARVRARYMLLVTSALMLTPALYYSKTRHSLYITTDMSSAVSPRRVGECCGARVRARYMLLVTSALMLTPALYYSKTRHSLYITTDMSSAVSPRRVGECCGARVRARYMLLVTSALMLTPALYYSKTRHSLYITTDMSSAVSPRRVGECCGARVRARYMLLVTSALMLTPALYYSKTRHSLYITTDMSSAVSPRRVGECCGARVRARYMLLVTSALMLTPALYYICAYLIMKLEFSYRFLWLELRPWRLLTLVMALPLGLVAAALWRLCESPKFLVNVGRSGEAVDALARIYRVNGGKGEFPVKEVYLEEGNKEEVGVFSLRSLWTQIAPLFQRPLLGRTLLLFYLTFVVYIANNSFAIILPTIFNVFFTSYASRGAGPGAGFCDLFARTGQDNSTVVQDADTVCRNSINDNTIWAGCAHGLSFFVLNALISQCAGKRKLLTIVILVIAAAAAAGVNLTGEPLSGLVLFYVFLTTAMVFGVVSSYFVTLYPTSYRGMVACLGMMVARLSAFSGTNLVSGAMTQHCSAALYGASGLVLTGAVAAALLPGDSLQAG